MLLQLLVCVSNPGLADKLEGLSGARVTNVDANVQVAEALSRFAPDVLLVDRDWLGSDPRGRVAELRVGARPVDFLYVAFDEDPDQRAAILGLGCLAVVDGRAGTAEFCNAVTAQLERWRERAISRPATGPGHEPFRLGDFVTASPKMRRFIETARRVSSSDTSVLILGETGVGKERLASAIHASGPRKHQSMVVVNCGAIPETLLESELFGHERGSFTGAERTHRGYFELAHGGTIFLDEVGEVPLHLQVKLLRVLQEREIRRVGGEKPIAVDVRVVAATNRDLQEEMLNKRFRSDLFYRLSVVTLTIPPLRDRPEDVSLLAEQFRERFARDLGAAVRRISPDAMKALAGYHWPGNVRELANVIERAVLLTDSEEVTIDDLPDAVASCYLPSELGPLVEGASEFAQLDPTWYRLPLRDARRAWNAAFERLYLEHVLSENRGKIGKTAAQTGIDPRSLYSKMRAFGLRKEDFR